jgi:apolipoprotein N-acyltransferase
MKPAVKERTLPLRNLGLAVLSGLLLTVSFPPGRFSWIAWIALVPLLVSFHGQRPRTAFKLGFVAGFFHFVSLVYWVTVVLGKYGHLHFAICLLALLLLSLYLALYPAFFSLVAAQITGTPFAPFFTAALWVGLEYLRTHLVTGFPWCLLGYSQYKQLMLIQLSDITGVYGISFLIVLVNALVFQTLLSGKAFIRGLFKWEWLLAVFMVAGSIWYGFQQLSIKAKRAEVDPRINATVVQANIDQSVKWKPEYQRQTVETYFRLSKQSAPRAPVLIIWPETALPFFYQNAPVFASRMHRFSDQMDSLVLFGSPAYKRKDGRVEYYNRAYLVAPGISKAARYDKRHLVPFGEYVPLKKYLPFINQLVEAAGNFASGGPQGPLQQKELSLGVLICFEAIFPNLARDLAREGAELLVNITNDAWFGRTSAPYQHLSMAVFRSIETGLPMVRAANTGFSAFIGSNGDILSRSPLFEEVVLERSVPFSPSTEPTLYTRFGDLFAWGMILMTLIKLLAMFRIRLKRKPK